MQRVKNRRCSGFSVHSNFIVNLNNASANDICKLLDVVKDKVKKEKGIVLETEIVCLGKFKDSGQWNSF